MVFPKVIASSVIRSAYKGQSHGGVYIIDLQKDSYNQVIDWNDKTINWEGRGSDRGLRGIDIYKNKIYLAASDEIFVYDKNFNLIESYKNKYLKHCHEIYIKEDTLFLTSTGYDSILEFDLISKKFVKGYCLRYKGVLTSIKIRKLFNKFHLNFKPELKIFNPNSNSGPKRGDMIHINNVFCSNKTIYFSGSKLKNLYQINGNRLSLYAKIPFGTHNAFPFKEGVLLNNTFSNQVLYLEKSGKKKESFNIPYYNKSELLNSDLPEDTARQGFARGLCVNDKFIIAGSSPATISVYEFGKKYPVKTFNISMDVRNAIHGLEIWPY